jgi:hypothetical protein
VDVVLVMAFTLDAAVIELVGPESVVRPLVVPLM